MTANDLISVPGSVSFRGVTHEAIGGITMLSQQPRTSFRTHDGHNRHLVKSLGYTVSTTIAGTLANLVPLLQFFAAQKFGRTVAPHIFVVESLVTGTDVLTITAHPFTTADAVYVGCAESFPTLASGSLSASTIYYVKSLSADTVSLHPTAQDATDGTATIDITAAGVGDFFLARQFPLTVHRETGVLRTCTSAYVRKFPSLVLKNGELLWNGNIEWGVVPAQGTTPNGTDEADFYAETSSAFTPPTFTGSDVRTAGAVTGTWGSAPWAAFRCEDGFKVDFEPVYQMKGDGVWPESIPILTDFNVKVTGRPLGIKIPDLGTANNRDLGDICDGSDLVLDLGDYTLTLVQAILDPTGETLSTSDNAIPELTWMAGGDGGTSYKPPFTLTAN